MTVDEQMDELFDYLPETFSSLRVKELIKQRDIDFKGSRIQWIKSKDCTRERNNRWRKPCQD